MGRNGPMPKHKPFAINLKDAETMYYDPQRQLDYGTNTLDYVHWRMAVLVDLAAKDPGRKAVYVHAWHDLNELRARITSLNYRLANKK